MAGDTSAWGFLGDKAIDVGVGVGTTFLGILLVYMVTRPRVIFGENVRVSRRADGRDRFRIMINNRKRLHPIVEIRITARLIVSNKIRQTGIPVPLSRDVYYNVRRPKTPKSWRIAARLQLNDIEWSRYLPPELAPPTRPRDLVAILDELDARLLVTTVSVASIFGTTRVESRWYKAANVEPAVGSYEGPQRLQLVDRVRDLISTFRLRGRGSSSRPPR